MGAEQGPVLHSLKAALSLPPPGLVLASPCHWRPCGCQKFEVLYAAGWHSYFNRELPDEC